MTFFPLLRVLNMHSYTVCYFVGTITDNQVFNYRTVYAKVQWAGIPKRCLTVANLNLNACSNISII